MSAALARSAAASMTAVGAAILNGLHLQGKLDPQGRYSVGMMFPSQAQWDKGARELRCGLQQTGKGGQPDQVAGRVIDNDQSFSWPPGTCIGIDQQTRRPTVPATVVGCSEPHAFQTTGIVDLSARFGNRTSGKPWPQIDDQNKFLAGICPAQAQRFLGGKEKLDATTLNTQWSVISEPSWLAGSRKVVCYIGLPDRGGFATLVGDARRHGVVALDRNVIADPDLAAAALDQSRLALERAEREGGTLRTAWYPNGWHLLNRDLDADIVYRDVVSWLRDPKAPLPSGAPAVLPQLQVGAARP